MPAPARAAVDRVDRCLNVPGDPRLELEAVFLECLAELAQVEQRGGLLGGDVGRHRPLDARGNVLVAEERLQGPLAGGLGIEDGRGHEGVDRGVIERARDEAHGDRARLQQPGEEEGLVGGVAGPRHERAVGTPQDARVRLVADLVSDEAKDALGVVTQLGRHGGHDVGDLRWRRGIRPAVGLAEREAPARTRGGRREPGRRGELEELAPVEHEGATGTARPERDRPGFRSRRPSTHDSSADSPPVAWSVTFWRPPARCQHPQIGVAP